MNLGRVVARRALTRGRSHRPVAVVEVGQPRKTKGHDDYYCPYRVTGVGDGKVRAAYGVDAVQALQLVSKGIAAELYRFPDLKWLGRLGTGFPLADESLPMERARAIDASSSFVPDEPVAPPGLWPPLEFYVSTSQPARTFMFTKVWFPRMWLRSDCFPDRADAVVHYGMPSRRHCELLRAHAKKHGTLFRFVGDMDPLDLAVFASLQRGGAPLRTRAAPAVPVVYAGIDDAWLRLCVRRLGDRPLTHVCIRQDATEEKLMSELVQAGMDVEALVGPRCAALLGEGLKLEIEGASNAAIYGRDFIRVLLPRLLRNAGRR